MSSLIQLVVIDVATWLVLSVIVGFGAAFIPRPWLASDSVITRIRPWERGGRFYNDTFKIKRWKDALPESNQLGPGNRQSKSALASRDQAAALVPETRRAEYVHWALACCGLLFWAWNPPWLAAVMSGFGLAFNAPFIAVQRYNRARARRVSRLGR